nr:PREDICTED: uncharacterized protein LOC102201755 [Pundamilia nyererei]
MFLGAAAPQVGVGSHSPTPQDLKQAWRRPGPQSSRGPPEHESRRRTTAGWVRASGGSRSSHSAEVPVGCSNKSPGSWGTPSPNIARAQAPPSSRQERAGAHPSIQPRTQRTTNARGGAPATGRESLIRDTCLHSLYLKTQKDDIEKQDKDINAHTSNLSHASRRALQSQRNWSRRDKDGHGGCKDTSGRASVSCGCKRKSLGALKMNVQHHRRGTCVAPRGHKGQLLKSLSGKKRTTKSVDHP